MKLAAQTSSIGDFIWNDLDGDGMQDAGEPGMAGITISLFGITGTGDTIHLSTVTDSVGHYIFDNLLPGNYKLTLLNLPPYFSVTMPNAGDIPCNNDFNPVTLMTPVMTLVSGQNDATVDGGLFIRASIGDKVWIDLNANGLQENNEPGLPGVLVELSGVAGNNSPVLLTAISNVSGDYLFTDLTPGTYKLTFNPVPIYQLTTADVGGNDAVDSDANQSNFSTQDEVLISGEQNTQYDAGYFQHTKIAGRVWHDTDGDGVEEPGEPGVPNIPIQLIGTSSTGMLVSETGTSGVSGAYLFAYLVPGTYRVSVAGNLGPQWVLSPPFQGSPLSDSDLDPVTQVSQPIILTSGTPEQNLGIGLYHPTAIGNFVWHDQNGNGIQDPGEPGLEEVIVTLTGNNGAGQPITLYTLTNANGQFIFEGLPPGSYKLTFQAPDGFMATVPDLCSDEACDSDPDPVTLMTTVEILVSGEINMTYDAGFFKKSALGNFVWNDLNTNGVQDTGEPGLDSVLVYVIGTTGYGLTIGNFTFTDSAGVYLFDNLAPGSYQLQFVAPPGMKGTLQNVGFNDQLDSDIDSVSLFSSYVVLPSGKIDLSVDAGFKTITSATFTPESLGWSCVISPNPFTAFARIQVRGQEAVTDFVLQIFDLQGNIVKSENSAKGVFDLDTSLWPSGIYGFRILAAGAWVGAGKLVKH